MAKRLISPEILLNPEFDTLTTNAQNLYFRLLLHADDWGVIAATKEPLIKRLDIPKNYRDKFSAALSELLKTGLGYVFKHDGQPYFRFKPESFEKEQHQLIRHRRRSKWLGLSNKECEVLFNGRK